MRLALPLWLVSIAACLPALSSVEGKRCNDAKQCPDDLFCVEGFCRTTLPAPDAGAPDAGPLLELLFTDACETVPMWYGKPNSTQLSLVPNVKADGGAFACKAVAEGVDGVPFGVELQLPGLVRRGRYCAAVAVGRGPSNEPTPRVSLVIETHRMDSTVVTASPPAIFDPDGGPGFRVSAVEVEADPQLASGVRLRLTGPLSRRATFHFDDLSVNLVGVDGTCPR